jgi:hypothetical protein
MKIVIFLAVMISLLSGSIVAYEWNVETIESDGDVGHFSSIALDSQDYPHIVHCDRTNGQVKYDFWDGSTWEIQVIDIIGTFPNTTNSISIAIDENDYPHVAYHNYNQGDLRYAFWDGSAWQIETVDSQGNVGKFASMKLDSNGYPHIAYCDWTDEWHLKLKYAHWDSFSWQFQIIDTLSIGGLYASLCLDIEDNPHISYHDRTTWSLKYAYWDGINWQVEIVDSNGNVGSYQTSLALDSLDHAHISYFEYNVESLKYAYGNYSNWQIETVDYGDAGWYSSLALDSYGYPHISHHGQGGELCYVEWDGTAWTSEIVPTESSFPVETSLALDSFNYPHISFLGDLTDLMYASVIYTGIQEQDYFDNNANQIAILYQNRPNPFNQACAGRSPQTTISYKLTKPSRISLSIYNIKGELVETLVNKEQQAGNHSVVWNAENISSGIYFYRFAAGNFSETKKCVILK